MSLSTRADLLEREDAGYEPARQAAVWNGYKPERYPEAIVLARTSEDVIEAVRYARERGLKVKARSGGHSWTASGLRDGALLVDLHGLTEIGFDPATQVATVGPGVKGRDLNGMLAE